MRVLVEDREPGTWLLPSAGPTLMVISALVTAPYLLPLLTKFVPSHLEAIKLQMVLGMEPQMDMSFYYGPETSGPPDCRSFRCHSLHEAARTVTDPSP